MRTAPAVTFTFAVSALALANAGCGERQTAGLPETAETVGTTVTTVSGETGPDTVDDPVLPAFEQIAGSIETSC